MQTAKSHPRCPESQYLTAGLGHLYFLKSSSGNSDTIFQGTHVLEPITLAHMNPSHTWISKEWEMNTLFLAMRIIFVCPSIGPQERLLLVSSQIRFPGLCTHRPAAGSVGFWGLPAAHLQRTAFSRNHQPEGCDLFAPPPSSKLSLRLTETGV